MASYQQFHLAISSKNGPFYCVDQAPTKHSNRELLLSVNSSSAYLSSFVLFPSSASRRKLFYLMFPIQWSAPEKQHADLHRIRSPTGRPRRPPATLIIFKPRIATRNLLSHRSAVNTQAVPGRNVALISSAVSSALGLNHGYLLFILVCFCLLPSDSCFVLRTVNKICFQKKRDKLQQNYEAW